MQQSSLSPPEKPDTSRKRAWKRLRPGKDDIAYDLWRLLLS